PSIINTSRLTLRPRRLPLEDKSKQAVTTILRRKSTKATTRRGSLLQQTRVKPGAALTESCECGPQHSPTCTGSWRELGIPLEICACRSCNPWWARCLQSCSELELFNLHATTQACLYGYSLGVFHRPTPFVNMLPATTNRVAKLHPANPIS